MIRYILDFFSHSIELTSVYTTIEVRGGAFGGGTALQVGRLRVRFPIISFEFFIDIIQPSSLPSSAVVKKDSSYASTLPMGRTACTEPQCL